MAGQSSTVTQKADGEKPHSSFTVLGELKSYGKRILKNAKAQQDFHCSVELPWSRPLAAGTHRVYTVLRLNQSTNSHCGIVYARCCPGLDRGVSWFYQSVLFICT